MRGANSLIEVYYCLHYQSQKIYIYIFKHIFLLSGINTLHLVETVTLTLGRKEMMKSSFDKDYFTVQEMSVTPNQGTEIRHK